ncbi:Caudovirales tail fiber assembly protein [compost metagenome]
MPDGAISTAPGGPHDKWNGTAWVKDGAAEKAALIQQARTEKARRMSEAGKHIAPLEDAVELKMATKEEKAQLTAWKTYRVLLSRVDPDQAPDITWPARSAQ